MLRATAIVRRPAVRADKVADTVVLDRAARGRAHGTLTTEGGLAFAVELPGAPGLDDGDALRLEDGRLVVVQAAAQRLLAVRAENPARLMRLAWQLGSHHVPAELAGDALYVEDDPNVADFVRGAGCTASAETRTFRPERETHMHGPDCRHDHADHRGHGHSDHAHADHDHGGDGHAHAHRDHGHGGHGH